MTAREDDGRLRHLPRPRRPHRSRPVVASRHEAAHRTGLAVSAKTLPRRMFFVQHIRVQYLSKRHGSNVPAACAQHSTLGPRAPSEAMRTLHKQHFC
eukprot:4334440-Prymnesium_polylepis.1